MTKPTFPLQSCRLRTGFRHSSYRSRALAPDTIVSSYFKGIKFFFHPRATALEWERECRNPVRERQLCSRDVASASSPGVPRHIQLCISTYTEAQEGLDLTAGDGDSGRAGEPSNHRYGYEVYQKTCNIELII